MVFPDISQDVSIDSLNEKKCRAHLMDRFFSFLLDYFVISPFVFFLLYTTFSDGFNFWRTNPTAPESDMFIIIISLCFVFYFSLAQSLFIVYLGSTPGQYFLKLKMDFENKGISIFFKAFIRQTSFWGSFLFFGLPFLSILTDSEGKTFYDKISDASVVTAKKDDSVFFDFEKEHKYWSSFSSTISVFMLLLFCIYIWKSYASIIGKSATFALLEQNKYFCNELSDVVQEERLSTAVALNLVGHLSDSCLDKEADFILWSGKTGDSGLAYFAKSLTTDDGDKENDYLDRACMMQGMGCDIATAFKNKNFESLYANLKSGDILADVLKYEIGSALSKKSETSDNFKKIAQYNDIKLVKKYQVVEMLSEVSTSSRAPASDEQKNNEDIIKLIEDL